MENAFEQDPPRASFYHPNNIEVGHAVVLWASEIAAIEGTRRVARPAGWVLPGGLRTSDKGEAKAWAHQMNQLMQRSGS